MYLKSIEVQGFKSFAQRIKFEFHNGITGIVGPNGSGKSNVADAVRWVFGEQSAKQLRSSNMQDVIFAGTQIRKPQSFAEVSITLSNEDRTLQMDSDEVTVTRKVYRMGESEYRLNGNLCRLKDINELFYDTGIGKEGYSIIGQGQVDKILSAKPEERRELFDEACGIVKFKKRKNEAQKKLENERQSMVRLTDILGELERQVGPLKKQSETAKEYLKLREELKNYDINAFLIDSKSYQNTLIKVAESLGIANAELEKNQAAAESLKQEYKDVESEIEDLEAKLEDVRSKLSEREAERAECESELKLAEEKIRSENAAIDRYETRIREIDAERENRETMIGDAKEEETSLLALLKDLAGEEEKLAQQIAEKETEISLYEKSIEESTGEVIGLLHQKTEVTSDLAELETLLSQNKLRLGEYETKQEALLQRKAELDAEMADLQKTCETLMDALEKLNAEYTEAEDALTEAEKNYRDADYTLSELKQKVQIDSGRLESVKSMQERYEGFQPAVRSVMEAKKRISGIEGTVADLVSVQEKYRTLIETALGGNYQNVIVDTEETAKKLVTYLKENRFGRATFLPLDAIRPSGGIQDPKILNETGVIGTADKLVGTDKRYLPAVRYLLERFLAVDTMENALQIARKYRYTVRIVTLGGEFLNVGGSITGGSFKSSVSILGRNDEIVKLENEIAESRRMIDTLERNLNRFRQVKETASFDCEDLEEEIKEKTLSLAESKAKYDSLKREYQLLEAELRDTEERSAEVRLSSAEAEGKRDAIVKTKEKIEKISSDSSDSADETKALLKAAEGEHSELEAGAEALRMKQSNAEQRLTFLSESKTTRETEKEKLAEERRTLTEEIEEAKANIEGHKETIEDYRLRIEEAKGSDTGLRSTLAILTGERESLSKSQKRFFDERDRLSETINDLNREIVRLEANQEKTEEKLASLTEYLWTEYELLPSEAEVYANGMFEDEKPSEIRRHANELKTAIRNLGPVNVNSIEEYKEVSERYEFLSGQYEDLKKAEESLVGIINDLDNGMRKQFLSEFDAIQKEFNVVFQDLFGGGTGTIRLNPDADVIDSDISIISEPPGKKLQNMMQLSGGEKALTAIALIFAIQNLKPSPFCLLDEIEAALDDTNVVRFTNYLKKLSERTQYIVITHRRGTMVATDRLYGITMQEKGVSTLVSVNLVEQDLDA